MHSLPNAKRKMASDSFVKLSEADIKSFSEEQENVNTEKKTLYDLKLFKEFLTNEEERRELQEIPAAKLKQFAINCVLGVRKKNGEEYEPSSLRGLLQSFDRFLRRNGSTFSLLNEKEFCDLQDVLKKKKPKQLKAIGKGNKPNGADVLSDNCPFYLAINTEIPKAGKNWFKAFPLGVNSLRSMVASQVQSNKKLVNRSTRKHLVQKLVDSNIPPNEIVQITIDTRT